MPDLRNRITGLRYLHAHDLLPNPRNFRTHPKHQRAALRELLDTVGIAAALVAYETPAGLQLIDGHLRADEAPDTLWPVLVLDVDEAEANDLLLGLDPIAALAGQDADRLAGLIESQRDRQGEAMRAVLDGLADAAGIARDAGPMVEDAEPQIDRAEELRTQYGVEVGQLWALGEHRIICGDSTDAAVVDRLLGKDGASCTVTDPPYGVGVEYASFDDTTENVRALIARAMPILQAHLPAALTPGVPCMWHYPAPAWVGAWMHPASTSSGPWGFVGCNPILYYGKDPYLSAGKGRRESSLVLASDRKGEDDHPVAKPLNVWSWLVERMTPDAKAIVFDPFSGAGTTILACEQIGRRCRAVEIDPGYVAVAIHRWESATGKQAARIE